MREMSKLTSTTRRMAIVAAGVLLMALAGASPALAESSWWHINSSTAPTYLSPGGSGSIEVIASNLGDGEVQASYAPVTIVDKLPANITVTSVTGGLEEGGGAFGVVECVPPASHEITCKFRGGIPPYRYFSVKIGVEASSAGPSKAESEVEVSGGEAPSASIKRSIVVSSAAVPFGVEDYELTPENEYGSPDTQAGSHPFQLTTTLDVNRITTPPYEEVFVKKHLTVSPELVKDLQFELPPGLIGNPSVLAQCSDRNFSAQECPSDTAIGVAVSTYTEPLILGRVIEPSPLYNLTPSIGEPARFGFNVVTGQGPVPVILNTAVRTGGNYGVVVSVDDITQLVSFLGSQVTFWGIPGDSRHDRSRGQCLAEEYCAASLGEIHPPPFLDLPTSCTGPLQTGVQADSWAAPGSFTSAEYTFANEAGQPYGLDGCDRLGFSPSVSVASNGSAGSTPTGLNVDVHVPQEEA